MKDSLFLDIGLNFPWCSVVGHTIAIRLMHPWDSSLAHNKYQKNTTLCHTNHHKKEDRNTIFYPFSFCKTFFRSVIILMEPRLVIMTLLKISEILTTLRSCLTRDQEWVLPLLLWTNNMKCYRECLRVEIFVYNLAAERFRDFIVCILFLTKKKDW